jgi:predicted adenine nucleotide alpha hydrolase (AANH) superfamily ATPase
MDVKKPEILIHGCCAHCTAYTVEHWRKAGWQPTVLWYNPNVHPFSEQIKRLEAMNTLAGKMDFPLVIAQGYDFTEYFRRVAFHEEDRCAACFDLRLSKTAEVALRLKIYSFSTSLLISPHQKHDQIKQAGEEAAQRTGAAFQYGDLRKRFSDSRHITKPMDLYRQQYCGCLFSEYERYAGDTPELSPAKPED